MSNFRLTTPSLAQFDLIFSEELTAQQQLINAQLQTNDHIDDIPSNQLCVNAEQDINLDFTPDEMTELLNDTNVCLSQQLNNYRLQNSI
jgi:hypothetical protein